MRTKLAAVVVALATWGVALPVGALTFLELTTGDDAYVPDARGAALGRTQVAGHTGAFTVGTNPALLGLGADGPKLSLGGNVFKGKETRSTPAFDSFDGFLVESVYALNDVYQLEGGVGVTLHGIRGLPAELGVGISFAPLWDFQYDYSEEVREPSAFTQPRDGLIATNEVLSDGAVSAWSFGVGGQVLDRLAVGGTLQLLVGDQTLVHRARFEETPEDNFAAESNLSSMSGLRGVLGLAARPTPRVDLGVTYRTEATVDADFQRIGDPMILGYLGTPTSPSETEGSLEIVYPQQVSFGAAYHPRAKLRTIVLVDFSWTEWSAFDHGLYEDLALEDTWDARVGVEHIFYNGFTARIGFNYAPTPQNDEVAASSFTFGAGFDVGPLHADLAFDVGSRDYRFEDLFDDTLFGGESRPGTDLVEESRLSGFLTVSYALDDLLQ